MLEMAKRKRATNRAKGIAPAGDRGDMLAADLMAEVSREDLAAFSGDEIAGFVATAADALARRKPGEPAIVISDPPVETSGKHGAVTVVTLVNDNMPFLFDSVLGELHDFGAEVQLVAHPMISVRRKSGTGELIDYLGKTGTPSGDGVLRESLIQILVTRLSAEAKTALAASLARTLAHVRRAVADFRPMQDRLRRAIEAFRADPPPLPPEEIDEAVAFLEWLLDGNFIFLGMREYDYVGGARNGRLERADRPALGILRDGNVRVLQRGGKPVHTTPAIREFLLRPDPLIITKSNTQSLVHRRGYMDYVGVKRYGRNGALAGELRIVGLFTSTAYVRPARSIPYVRRKIEQVIARAAYDPNSHSGKALVNILETYPREELFQIDEDSLFASAMAIVRLGERPRVRIIARRDRFDRFVSVLVFVPRDRHNTTARIRIGEILAEAFHGHVSASQADFPEGSQARIHYIIGREEDKAPEPDRADLETAVANVVETWADGLKRSLAAAAGGDDLAASRLARFKDAFPDSYRDDFSPEIARADIAAIERLSDKTRLSVRLSPGAHRHHTVRLRLIHRGAPIALSVRVPMLENMGFRVLDERTYAIAPAGDAADHLHDMALERPDGGAIDLARLDEKLLACFVAVWEGRAESDGYNALVLNGGIAWRDVALLRALSRYLLQATGAYSQDYMWTTLNRHHAVAAAIVELFHARFDPARTDDSAEERFRHKIDKALDGVESLDEDRIIRRFAGLVSATLRTNFFQLDVAGQPKDEIVFKLDSQKVDGLPRPRPFREIFVYSPRLEAVHLRFGRIARGGIRWSDRPQDFRTEILGLAKAQQVKNAVIVPVGAKGGFVPKQLPAGGAAARDAVLAEATAVYRIFMDALLDITDNLDGAKVVAPDRVVAHDEPDPYLVVAADKGTASFSDLANEIAVEHRFWLGDAFASGGSAGYDHKAMGITARGAFEAVKRHFREMDIDIETTAFTVAGVGDMSGDVFGNGMLLSPVTKLVAAFDHRDIFIDPAPDPAISLAERRRLFDLPRSSWQDYDKKVISKGGGVFSRKVKAIPLNPAMRSLLGLAGESATPHEVITAILKAEVDLLWFGGIGTFVRATGEPDDKVGDRANDALRVNAADLRAKVVGEGANLAMTQRARVEYGLLGGRLNSDAIDNSAGVNTSDVEVNIKIALAEAIRTGALAAGKRNRFLKSMTGEVATLVLRNNYLQTLAISLTELRGMEDFGFQLRLMQALESRGLLDRALEALPDNQAMAERQKAGRKLTRPEIALLLAYAKIALNADLLQSDLPDEPALAADLVRYFPEKMGKTLRDAIANHRLKREIVATAVANSMINRGGPTFVERMSERTAAAPPAIARAYIAVRGAFALRDLNDAIDALDGKIGGMAQLALYRAAEDLLLSRTAWFLRNVSLADGIAPVLEAYGATIATVDGLLRTSLPAHAAEAVKAEADRLAALGVPAALARRIARLPALAAATDIHLVAAATSGDVGRAAAAFFAVDDHFHIAGVQRLANSLSVADYADGLALDRALETLADAHRRIAIDVIAADGADGSALQRWIAGRPEAALRVLETIAALVSGETPTVSRVTVAAGLLADLASPTRRG